VPRTLLRPQGAGGERQWIQTTPAKGWFTYFRIYRPRKSVFDGTSNTYYDWLVSKPYLISAAQTATARFVATFKEFPPRQKAPSFSIDQAMDKMKKNLGVG
jgi:hypothetical protein